VAVFQVEYWELWGKRKAKCSYHSKGLEWNNLHQLEGGKA